MQWGSGIQMFKWDANVFWGDSVGTDSISPEHQKIHV